MRLLFLCNTPYQVLVASCICRNCFSDSMADIIISDHMTGYEQIAKQIQGLGMLFERVYALETKHYYEFWNSISGMKKRLYLLCSKKIESTIKINENYDLYFCANADPFSILLFSYLKTYNNKKIQACWYEDGLGTYSFDKKYFESNTNKVKVALKRICGMKILTEHISKFYLFQPECMDWQPDAQLKKIPIIDREDKKFIYFLNKIFGYDKNEDTYNKSMIFFEDGYGDWEESTDIELVNLFRQYIPKEQIMVKIHPRNTKNRFKEQGYLTNKNTGIPWEVIALNNKFDNTVLVTMYSQSVIMPYVLFGESVRAVILAKLDDSFKEKDHIYFDYLNKYYYARYPDMFFVPETEEDLKEYLQRV